MEQIESKEYSREQIKRAAQNYAKYLEKNCSKQELIKIVGKNLKNYFPDELCIAHLND